MKKILVIFICFFLFNNNVNAITNYSYIVMDIDSGRIIEGNNFDSKKLIASTTKIMTCIVTLENMDIHKKIVVGNEVLKVDGTNIYLSVGEIISVEDLLYGLMLRSGNDAAMSLAVNVFSSLEEFVNKMNQKALDIGMKNTIFNNPHGLDDVTYNYSTAYDMALLSRYAYNNKMYRKIISTKKYEAKSNIKSYIWSNRVSLLNQYKYCIGGKNGYTPKAGKSLVSLAKKDDLVLTVVSLDDDNIYTNHKRIYNNIFSSYHNYTIVDKDDFFINSPFIHDYYLKKSFKYPLSDSEIDNISTFVEIDTHYNTNNSSVGKVLIRLDNKKIGEVLIYRKKSKKKKELSLFQKIKNYLFDMR